jgi:hypothetical protein
LRPARRSRFTMLKAGQSCMLPTRPPSG